MDLVNQILVDEGMVVFPIQLVQTPHFPQYLIRLIIKDVIKELSKVQKDQGTLVHEIISENCFSFFSEAMKIARDRDL